MSGIGSPALWVGFLAFVLAMLALDLGVFHRKDHAVRFREALGWSVAWVGLALLLGAGVWWQFGQVRGIEYLTGYLIEKSLAVDNIFVFVVIFATLKVPAIYQHRVLFWGILSALLMRAAMIFAGAAMLQRFHWLMYVFGGLLVLTGIKLFAERSKPENVEGKSWFKLARRLIPTTPALDGNRFFTKQNGRWLATPLFMALLLIEVSDIIFAVDSIPAIFAVTSDPFIVFTSNIMAILGLRSMFFLFAGLLDKFHYLKVGLSAVLVFVGIKMLVVEVYKIPATLSLLVIALLLGSSVVASLVRARRVSLAESARAAEPASPAQSVS